MTIDIHGTRAGTTGDDATTVISTPTDFLYEVGSGGVVAELDEQLAGRKPGDIFDSTSSLGPEGRDRLVPGAGQGGQGAGPSRR